MKDRIETWKRAFEEDDQGVLPTLVDFSWNYAAYTTIAKIVEHSPETEDGRKNLNYMVLNLLASGYWQSATLAIRRLVYCFEINEPFHFGTVIVCTATLDE